MPSLLSLPDELLVRTFDYRAQRFGTCDNPLVPLLSVSRRVRHAAQSILYSEVVLGSDPDAMACFEAVVQQNPAVGQLVGRLTIHTTDSATDRPRLQLSEATIRTFTQLRELTLHGATFDEASAVLAALPSPRVRRLDLQLANIIDPLQREDLWALTSRFSELRVLKIDTCDVPVDFDPSVTAPAAPKGALPRLVELHLSDSFLIKTFGAAGPFRQFLPSLRELHLMITQSDLMPAVTTILSEPPSSFTTLKLPNNLGRGVPSRYFQALPASLRHLQLGSNTFYESELVAYLATANLESIGFEYYTWVTDRLLQRLTGRARPPQLRRIRLDHIDASKSAEIERYFKRFGTASLSTTASEVREDLGPNWPGSGAEEGLRRALASALANGIEVTGSALDCVDWNVEFDRLLVDYLMEDARLVGRYDQVMARFGRKAVVAWLEEHAPEQIQFLRPRA